MPKSSVEGPLEEKQSFLAEKISHSFPTMNLSVYLD